MHDYLRPVNWKRWLTQFVVMWFISLKVPRIVAGVPFILLLAAIASGYVLVISDSGSFRNRLLDRQLTQARLRDDYQTERLILRRKLNTNPDSRQLKLELARAFESTGELEEAVRLMRSLAFPTGTITGTETVDSGAPAAEANDNDAKGGDVRAARWLVQTQFVSKSWNELDGPQRRELGALLRRINDSSPNDLAMKQLYVDYLMKSQQYPEALEVLDSLTVVSPLFGVQAAFLAKSIGNAELTTRYAQRALEKLNEMIANEPKDLQSAAAAAQCLILLDRHQQAFESTFATISRIDNEKDQLAMGQLLAETVAAWIDAIENNGKVSSSDRVRILQLLQVALQYAPNNPKILTLVAFQVLATVNDTDEQLVTLRNSLTSGAAPGITHFIKGTAAVMKDDLEAGAMHLEIAAKTMPGSAIVLNNLAHVLAHQKTPDLVRALKFSQMAIDQTPGAGPIFYETRGHILHKMGKHIEAIPDLEKALLVPQLAPQAHETLAACYAALGNTELVEQHTAAAEHARGLLKTRQATDAAD